jgi:hypothetical protein
VESREGGKMSNEELSDLAFNIADEASATVIECHTLGIDIDGVEWRDFEVGTAQHASDWENLSDEVDYLEARGTLHRHPTRPGVVRIEETA